MEGTTSGELSFLPEDCIANVISFTNPRDACRLSSVSKIFKSAAESNAVWERFLPPEYTTFISNSTSSSSLVGLSSKKELYLGLCENPILIDDGKKTFSLDKHSGKKCYMISARDLIIIWSDTPTYWRWSSIPEARFPEVAELISVCWFEIRGKINTRSLSPRTFYTAYFVYKQTGGAFGFEYQPVEVKVGLAGSEPQNRTVYLNPEIGQRHRHLRLARRPGLFRRNRNWRQQGNYVYYPKQRKDKWLEIELGDYFYEGDEEDELEMSILEVVGGDWKGGLIVQGIEIRPKQGI